MEQKERGPGGRGENTNKHVSLPLTLQNFADFDLDAYVALVFQIARIQLRCIRKMAVVQTGKLNNIRRQPSFNTCASQCAHDKRWVDKLVQGINMLDVEKPDPEQCDVRLWHPRLHSSKWIRDHNKPATKTRPVVKSKSRAVRKFPA